MSSYRLAAGGCIDRSKTLEFQFDGQTFTGHPGDTLASALLASGVRLIGRSFKYHRPRGVMTAGVSEPNALATIGEGGRRMPNTRATMVELYDGLVAESQNRWPSLSFDLGAVNGWLSPFLKAGFYYKTFMWPRAFWEGLYEPLIRRAAGLGRAGCERDPDAYEKAWTHCDLLIVGAGPAGLAAALTAGRAGVRVIVVDENAELGGSLLIEGDELVGVVAELAASPRVRLMPRTTAFGWYDDNVFGALQRPPGPGVAGETLWRIAARRALLCTGAEQRPIVFGGNDRPGVMLADAALAYARRYGVAVGRRVAVFTADDSGLRAARQLQSCGVEVETIIDARRGEYVISTAGGRALSKVTAEIGGERRRFDADALLMSGGYNPRIHLACHRGAKPRWSETHGAFLAPEGPGALRGAGAANGAATYGACWQEGAGAAASLIGELGFAARPAQFANVADDGAPAPSKPYWRSPKFEGKAFVDFQNDVLVDDLTQAVSEGYDHIELAKRYTTGGMATDQGKLSNVNAIGILAEARGVSPATIGTTTFRPFYTPVSFGALAGAHRGPDFQPTRRSPLEAWAKRRGAVLVEAGLWMRSSYFPRPGETHWRQTVDREAATVREAVGLCDVSTLGKIELVGPDVGAFLDRVYGNTFSNLAVGRARYGLMLREDGFVFDDGATSRLAPERYLMTTTTAAAADVLRHLEFCAQVVWPELKIRFASVTDQWAQMALAGPKSRDVLQSVVDDDVSNDAVPHLAARQATLLGGRVRARLFRLSFSGELAYEIAVPARLGDEVAEALMRAGAAHGICAYGVEAMGVLRIEKGHVTHNEINGTVTATDLGLGKLASRTKADFIGRAMLGREGLIDPNRWRLVGLTPLDPETILRAGAHVLNDDDAATLANDQGYVTSSCHSPHLRSQIALALVKRGAERHGETVQVWNALGSEYARARITAPVFVDPDNRRLHG